MLIDYEQIEEDLSKLDDPNEHTWYNERVWRTIALIAAIFVIQYASTTIYYTNSGWTWDFNLFASLCLGSIPSLVVIGLRVEMGVRRYIAKRRIVNGLNDKIEQLQREISQKNAEIDVLKAQLNDRCETYWANQAANAKISEEINDNNA